MDKFKIEKEVKELLHKYGFNETSLVYNASFKDDLNLSELDFAELVIRMEIKFDVFISFEKDKLDTIADLVNTIENKLNNLEVKRED